MSFANPSIENFYGEDMLNSFFDSFCTILTDFVNKAKIDKKSCINFIGDIKNKNGIFMDVFSGMIIDDVCLEASNKIEKDAYNVMCKDVYNSQKLAQCFVDNEMFIWNTDENFDLNQQRCFAEELMFEYDKIVSKN